MLVVVLVLLLCPLLAVGRYCWRWLPVHVQLQQPLMCAVAPVPTCPLRPWLVLLEARAHPAAALGRKAWETVTMIFAG